MGEEDMECEHSILYKEYGFFRVYVCHKCTYRLVHTKGSKTWIKRNMADVPLKTLLEIGFVKL